MSYLHLVAGIFSLLQSERVPWPFFIFHDTDPFEEHIPLVIYMTPIFGFIWYSLVTNSDYALFFWQDIKRHSDNVSDISKCITSEGTWHWFKIVFKPLSLRFLQVSPLICEESTLTFSIYFQLNNSIPLSKAKEYIINNTSPRGTWVSQ